MKTSTSYIIEKLNNIFSKHSYLEIQYEYRTHINTHIIHVLPAHCFDGDRQYIEQQISFEDEFENLFPHENILFITDNLLINVENPILKLGVSTIKVECGEANESLKLQEIVIKQPEITYLVCDEYSEFTPMNMRMVSESDNWFSKIKNKIKKPAKKALVQNQSLFLFNIAI